MVACSSGLYYNLLEMPTYRSSLLLLSGTKRRANDMNCPNCGTYNPEGREKCWRCDKPLPKPRPQKKKDPQKTARIWLYVAVAVFLVVTLLQTCGLKLPFGPQPPQEQEPSGHSRSRTPIVYLLERPWGI